jgi:hypothetical protein
MRTDILEAARDMRRQKLNAASRDWVDPEMLEKRIDEALEAPVPINQVMQMSRSLR